MFRRTETRQDAVKTLGLLVRSAALFWRRWRRSTSLLPRGQVNHTGLPALIDGIFHSSPRR